MTRQARYPNDPTSVPAARRFVENALPAGLAAEVGNRLALMVSEVATNAVKHARSHFTLSVHTTSDEIRVEIRDYGGGRPIRRHPPPTQPHGRGLLIVEAIADDWGIDQHRRGTTVWFTTTITSSNDRGAEKAQPW